MLKGQPDISVVASLSNGDALVRGKRFRPDVILLDFVLKSSISLRLVQTIRTTFPDSRIIVMDLAPVQPAIVDYVRAGVAGFVLKDATFDEFLHAIRDVAHGKKFLPPILTSSLFSDIIAHAAESHKGNPSKSIRITGREREVIELIAGGMSNKQIATRLNLAVDTVKSHVHNILEKLHLHTRLEIASYRHVGGPPHGAPESPSAED
jgi:DNA-binding NarL/FixJ family response regulator